MLNQIDPVVENSPVPTGNFEDFPSPQKSFLAVSPNKFYHKPEPLRPLVYGILTLADRAGNASQDDKGGRGDA
ncbi:MULTISPECIES: hypothetical protein [unclassified Microcystis]|jgi:hypothetical protein|uniref:hypothetical protein n=1 Tax=unclassified Microcystis TaxID=2643300 RepID=UPI0022C00EC0|nr:MULTISPECIES: hypothetical protein [unclassified Microcystis]MCA2693641.1 hypothetical protein [Microcystis sp. M034S2]MCA2749920.1 hypothetical protein [Microcystis sp. M144S2]MCZ8201777.1 hypothetical protein [Microcystis sp. LE19-55.1A]